jgi:hypothetical protein
VKVRPGRDTTNGAILIDTRHMSFDPTWLFVSLIPGGIGFVLFVYGKKQERWPHLVAGLLLMVYPYFTPSLVALVATGGAICAGLWYALRLGW